MESILKRVYIKLEYRGFETFLWAPKLKNLGRKTFSVIKNTTMARINLIDIFLI